MSGKHLNMIVVTGGAGFIGSNLVAGLEARGERSIVVCDRLGSGDKWRNISRRALAGIVPPENLLAYLDNAGGDIRAVFHLGAISATTATDVDLVMDTNFRLSTDIWAICARHGVPLIYASSAATYGDGAGGFDDDMAPEALARLKPLNPYGWSKHLFDRWVAQRMEDGAVAPPQWAGLKFFNVYGPNEYHKEGQISVVLKNFREVAAGGPAVLFKSHNADYADGGQKRDFVWVGDCVAAMLWLMDNPGVNGLFNLGTGKARSFADLAAALFDAMGRPADIEYIATPEAIRDKYQYFTEARMARLGAAGFDAPFTGLEQGVSRYVTQYLATDDPYA